MEWMLTSIEQYCDADDIDDNANHHEDDDYDGDDSNYYEGGRDGDSDPDREEMGMAYIEMLTF